jgi:hypothetical protein
MSTRQLIALTASVLIVGSSIALFRSASHGAEHRPLHQPMVIDGRPVVNLPEVIVHPSARDLREAYLQTASVSTDADSGRAHGNVSLGIGSGDSDSPLAGSAFAMPYYSFGAPMGSISKE